jgi:MoaA/NifB/PqqE/SkfB family radical SAM enzyme
MIKLRNPLKAQLKIAYLVVTYACNNKCNFCYAQSMLKKFIEGEELVHMPLEFAYQIVSELKSLGVNRFHLIGGEPTVYPYLLDLVRFIKQDPRVYVAIVTNGRKIGDEAYLKDLVDAGVNGFQISIQGADAEMP